MLAVLATGCGLLVERAAGVRLPGTLLPGAGLALIVVVAELATQLEATAELAAPLVVICTVAGVALSERSLVPAIDGWAAGTAVAVFCVFAAPTVLSGEATFAGYIKLQDTATWVAITDHVMEHGRDLDGLPRAPYGHILDLYLGDNYPAGAFLPLGVGHAFVGQDLPWLVQPYLAFLAAMLALALYSLAGSLIASRPLRALAAVFASQAALLFAYSLWGAMKELVAAWLIALTAALVARVLSQNGHTRAVLPLAVATSAMLASQSLAGGVWLLPLLGGALAIAFMVRSDDVTKPALTFVGAAALLSLPSIVRAGSFLPVASDVLTSQSELGSLTGPLRALQAFGIWPAGDFRTDPSVEPLTYALIAIAAAAAAAGVALAVARRAWGPLLYAGGTVVAVLVLVAAGSPWTDAKAFAVGSPALLFTSLAGAAALFESGRRLAAAVAMVAIVSGVAWSNALAYREVDLAPRERLEELRDVGGRIDGEGPTLTTEFELWGLRHFLRSADAVIAFRGLSLTERDVVDLDSLELGAVLGYRTLVLRRSPLASRPPAAFRLSWSGRYYEIWQRRPGERVLEHLPLGRGGQAVSVPSCRRVLSFARSGGGRLAAVVRPRATIVNLSETIHPPGWGRPGADPAQLFPAGAGTAETRVRLPAGRHSFWLEGSWRGELSLAVDGRVLRSVRHQLDFYSTAVQVPMGEAQLPAGVHTLTLRYEGSDLAPGSAGDAVAAFGQSLGRPFGIGPLIASRSTAASPVTVVPGSRARSVCGRSLDWLETLE